MALRDEHIPCPACGAYRLFAVDLRDSLSIFLGMYCGTCRALTSPEGLLDGGDDN